MIADALNIVVTAFIVWSLYNVGFREGNLKELRSLLCTLRPIMFLANLPVIGLVGATVFALNNVPALAWGWSSLLSSDGSTTNVNMIGLQNSLIAPVFVLLLFVALPYLAKLEEEIFREGTTGLKSALVRSVIFGLLHLVAGISLSIAIALIIAGLWFSYQYKRGGVERSTAYHIAWNYTLVGFVAITLLVDLL